MFRWRGPSIALEEKNMRKLTCWVAAVGLAAVLSEATADADPAVTLMRPGAARATAPAARIAVAARRAPAPRPAGLPPSTLGSALASVRQQAGGGNAGPPPTPAPPVLSFSVGSPNGIRAFYGNAEAVRINDGYNPPASFVTFQAQCPGPYAGGPCTTDRPMAMVVFEGIQPQKYYMVDCTVITDYAYQTSADTGSYSASADGTSTMVSLSHGHLLFAFQASYAGVNISLQLPPTPGIYGWEFYGCDLHAVE
jgi:hypothetical protein